MGDRAGWTKPFPCDDYVAGYDARGHSEGCVTCGFAAYCHGLEPVQTNLAKQDGGAP